MSDDWLSPENLLLALRNVRTRLDAALAAVGGNTPVAPDRSWYLPSGELECSVREYARIAQAAMHVTGASSVALAEEMLARAVARSGSAVIEGLLGDILKELRCPHA